MVNLPPIKMVMTGGWCVYDIVVPTLSHCTCCFVSKSRISIQSSQASLPTFSVWQELWRLEMYLWKHEFQVVQDAQVQWRVMSECKVKAYMKNTKIFLIYRDRMVTLTHFMISRAYDLLVIISHLSILFNSIQFYSILVYSFLFYSILFYSFIHSIYLSINLSIYLSTYLCIYLSTYLPIYLSI